MTEDGIADVILNMSAVTGCYDSNGEGSELLGIE